MTTPPVQHVGFFQRNLRLLAGLFTDGRVPIYLKAIPLATVAYVLSPIDVIPDVVLGLGQLDDIALTVLAFKLFIDLAPDGVVQEHLARIQGRPFPDDSMEGTYRVVPED